MTGAGRLGTLWIALLTGALVAAPMLACDDGGDADADVDQMDFAEFQPCLVGAGLPADPNCMD